LYHLAAIRLNNAANTGRDMRYVAIFEDSLEMVAVRSVAEPAHLAFLEINRMEISMAGGLRNEHGDAFVGALWVFEVESKERAVELIESDPYFLAHPRKYRLLAWGKALPQYQVTL
jgi:uncharacterized protein YciI